MNTHTCMPMHAHAHTHACTHARARARASTHTHTHTNAHTYTHKTHEHIHVNTQMNTCEHMSNNHQCISKSKKMNLNAMAFDLFSKISYHQ